MLEPYYALLKAENKEHAKLEYNASIAELEDINDIYEVPEDYALVRFSQTHDENNKLVNPKKVLEEFKDNERCILAVDRALL